MKKYSIIIPVHNAQDRICKCLDSIEKQTFTDYEIICVCDSCTDMSANLCRAYTDKVFEVDYSNAGLTRDKGLDEATGEYVLFLDDDDWWLHELVLEGINQRIEDIKQYGEEEVDVLCMGFYAKGNGFMPPRRLTGDWVNVWSKAWRREAIGSTRFPNVYPDDDYQFTKLMYAKPLVVKHYDFPIYYYNYLREGSISETEQRKKSLF